MKGTIMNIREILETTNDKDSFLWTLCLTVISESVVITKVCNGKDQGCHGISDLHYNVQSLNSKLAVLEVLVQSYLKFVSVLCFAEHWQKD
jgi:hypothetical protein